jgi:fructose-bisphosphate aldolase class II
MIVTTKKLFEAAYGKYAIGAYNINNLEQTMGLFRGCLDSQAPFIIQISKGARSYTHKNMLEGLIPFLPCISIMGTKNPAMIALRADFTAR